MAISSHKGKESLGDILELVVGAFGEASSDLDRVITALAESRGLWDIEGRRR